jgi:hypothetical protein
MVNGTERALRPEMIASPNEALDPSTILFPTALGTDQFTIIEASQFGRLKTSFRDAARREDPTRNLTTAAIRFLDGDPWADAYADLAVTGRASYEAFTRAPLTDALLFEAVRAARPTLPTATIQNAVTHVLDRAYQVAWAMRGPYPQRAAVRRTLGWIAVSGEDDSPHRPVNNACAPYPQYEIPVTVGLITVKTRFFIASPPRDPACIASSGLPLPRRTLPDEGSPCVPAGDRVLLFVHGHSSSAEEALPVIPWIHQEGAKRGVSFSVISVDLPSNGYSEMIEHTDVAPSTSTTYPDDVTADQSRPINTPILTFIEDFLVAFVNALEPYTPIKNRFAGVIGGSLGGSMGLRLGRRADLDALPWLANGTVSWSPASVWEPKIHGTPSPQCRAPTQSDSMPRNNT